MPATAAEVLPDPSALSIPLTVPAPPLADATVPAIRSEADPLVAIAAKLGTPVKLAHGKDGRVTVLPERCKGDENVRASSLLLKVLQSVEDRYPLAIAVATGIDTVLRDRESGALKVSADSLELKVVQSTDVR